MYVQLYIIRLMVQKSSTSWGKGSFSSYLQGFIHPTGGWEWDFWTIKSSYIANMDHFIQVYQATPKATRRSSKYIPIVLKWWNLYSTWWVKTAVCALENDMNSKWSMDFGDKSRGLTILIIQLLVEIPIFVAGIFPPLQPSQSRPLPCYVSSPCRTLAEFLGWEGFRGRANRCFSGSMDTSLEFGEGWLSKSLKWRKCSAMVFRCCSVGMLKPESYEME